MQVSLAKSPWALKFGKTCRLTRHSHLRGAQHRLFATVNDSIKIDRVSGAVGAEIHGVDLRNLEGQEAAVKTIRQALLDNGVVFFRKQELTPSQYLEASKKFGNPVEYPFVKGIEGYPEIIHVLKQEHEKNNFGGIWHSDTVYQHEPPMGTVLYAKEIPPRGGDTLFASQVAAYEALSDGLKATLETLTGINTSAKAAVSKTREDRVGDSGNKADDLISYHPVVRTHPETGKKALFVNVAHTERFDGWTEAESAALLQFLHQHQIKPEFTCRFKWDVGSIAFWDNRQVQHYPINDYHGYRRSMHRITLAGDKPR